jgi:hypothetical protein
MSAAARPSAALVLPIDSSRSSTLPLKARIASIVSRMSRRLE